MARNTRRTRHATFCNIGPRDCTSRKTNKQTNRQILDGCSDHKKIEHIGTFHKRFKSLVVFSLKTVVSLIKESTTDHNNIPDPKMIIYGSREANEIRVLENHELFWAGLGGRKIFFPD